MVQVARLTSQLDAATEENIRLKNELDSATDSLARNASAATAFSSLDLPQARAALASSKSKLKELEAEVGSTTERVRTLEVELQTSKDESDAVRTKLANAEIASADGEKKALARVDQLLAAVSKMEIKIVTLESVHFFPDPSRPGHVANLRGADSRSERTSRGSSRAPRPSKFVSLSPARLLKRSPSSY